MIFNYDVTLSVDLGALFAPVGDLLKQVNTHLAEMGCREKLGVRSKVLHFTFTTERELSKRNRDLVKKYLIELFTKEQPAWKVKVESFRRKSGNVQQSVS